MFPYTTVSGGDVATAGNRLLAIGVLLSDFGMGDLGVWLGIDGNECMRVRDRTVRTAFSSYAIW